MFVRPVERDELSTEWGPCVATRLGKVSCDRRGTSVFVLAASLQGKLPRLFGLVIAYEWQMLI
jgi:hypothetical protein